LRAPLIELDVQISRIRPSDKTSRIRPQHVAPERGQALAEVRIRLRDNHPTSLTPSAQSKKKGTLEAALCGAV
jgi:hypothetical protein